jgi:hypothetical protein
VYRGYPDHGTSHELNRDYATGEYRPSDHSPRQHERRDDAACQR